MLRGPDLNWLVTSLQTLTISTRIMAVWSRLLMQLIATSLIAITGVTGGYFTQGNANTITTMGILVMHDIAITIIALFQWILAIILRYRRGNKLSTSVITQKVISAIIRFIIIINLVITPMFTSFKTRTIITTGTTIINVAIIIITLGNDLLGRFDYWDYMTSGFLPISGESLEHLYFYW